MVWAATSAPSWRTPPRWDEARPALSVILAASARRRNGAMHGAVRGVTSPLEYRVEQSAMNTPRRL
eukprot:4323830-Alexandrium_andersonii.AAC.1